MWVQFLECRVEVTVGSLLMHHQIQNGVGRGYQGGAYTPPPREAQTYQFSFPKWMLRLRCPVEGCLSGASNWSNLQVHFAHLHLKDITVILKKGK